MPAVAEFTMLAVSLHNHGLLITLHAQAFYNLCVTYKFLRLDQIFGIARREKTQTCVPGCLLSLTVFILC